MNDSRYSCVAVNILSGQIPPYLASQWPKPKKYQIKMMPEMYARLKVRVLKISYGLNNLPFCPRQGHNTGINGFLSPPFNNSPIGSVCLHSLVITSSFVNHSWVKLTQWAHSFTDSEPKVSIISYSDFFSVKKIEYQITTFVA